MIAHMTGQNITLVTVTYNAATVWKSFTACLMAQQGVNWHLIVVDNNSQDSTIDLLRLLKNDPRVTLVLNDVNLGVAAANNQGIRIGMANGSQRIALLNNDTEFGYDLLLRLIETQDANQADAVSPLIPYFSAPDLIWYGGGSFRRYRGVMCTHDHEMEQLDVVGLTPFATDYAPTCCVMFDRSVFERIGEMDERYFVYWDDTDFMWRFHMAGMKLVVDPQIVFLHKVSISTGGRLSDFSIRYTFRNQIYYTHKFHGPLWALYTAVMAMSAGVWRLTRNGDTPRHLLLRYRALKEGFAMARS